jgi:hypothetical protein
VAVRLVNAYRSTETKGRQTPVGECRREPHPARRAAASLALGVDIDIDITMLELVVEAHGVHTLEGRMAEGFAKFPVEVTFAPYIRRLDDTCLEVKMMAYPGKDGCCLTTITEQQP